MKAIRIMLVGDSTYQMYSQAFYDAWRKLGYQDIYYFQINNYFDLDSKKSRFFSHLLSRAQNKMAFGPRVQKMNREMLKIAKDFKPDLVFLYNTRHIYRRTLEKMKNDGSIIFLYSNDNPFGESFPQYYWRHFKRGLAVASAGFAYRTQNLYDFEYAGCKKVYQLRSYYIAERNYFIEKPTVQVPKVVFLGHYENDERGEYIKALLDQKIEVGIMKMTWEHFEENNPYLVKLENAHAMYNQILNATEIAIVFLSKINHDTYTRRCFEIPAVKTMMIAPYTKDIAAMYTADKEVVFYSSKEEFVNKICYYLEHEDERKKIAEAGYRRLLKGKNEVTDRVQYVMDVFDQACSM